MGYADEWDAVTVEQLRARGWLKWTEFGAESVGAFVAEMDFGTAPVVVEAVRASVDAMAFGYLPDAMADALSAACAGWQRERYGWDVRPEWVTPLPDLVKGLEVAIAYFSRPGSPVILPTPAYMPFLELPEFFGRELLQVPMARDGGRHVLDPDAIDAAYRAGGDLLVHVNPHNPLGRVFTAAEHAAVTAVVDRHGGRVFADEIHSPLTYPGHAHVPYAATSETAARHTVTATSASKAWNLPGLKCAQLILTNAADAATLEKAGPFAAHGASNPGVVANTVAYTAGGPWLAEVLAYLDGNRQALARLVAERLPGVHMDVPEGTYLAWLDLRGTGLGDNPAAVIRERTGIALTEGPRCGGPGAGFARLNFATPRPVLERLVDGVASAVVPHRGRLG